MTPKQQKAFFNEQGYLVVEDLVSADLLAACGAEIRRLHQLAADLAACNDPAAKNFQREPFAGDSKVDDLPVLRKMEQTREHSDLFRSLSAHPPLVAVLQNLLGPDLLLFRSTLMLKPAFHGSVHALHQDSAYWPMEPPRLVTVSIALTDSTRENGCFQVIPRSNEWGIQQWGNIQRPQDDALTDRQDIDQSGKIDVPLKAGSVLLFHSLLVHGSGPNRSPHSRHTALYAYFSPNVKYKPPGGEPREKTFPVIAGFDGREEMTFTAEPAAEAGTF